MIVARHEKCFVGNDTALCCSRSHVNDGELKMVEDAHLLEVIVNDIAVG